MTSPLWTNTDSAAATAGSAIGTWSVTGLSIDSRTLQPGDLFIAIKGDKFDGHDHAAAALAKGASAVMISHRPADLPDDAPVLQVQDTMQGLLDLAKAARMRSSGAIIAITGSVGKTTTKEMLQQVAQAQFPTHATTGNLNNHIGLPLTLARLPHWARYGIFEIGMNHPGEIEPLSTLLQPGLCLITAIGTAHIENFSEGAIGIAKAKAEIFAGTKGGVAILPKDTPFHDLLLEEATRRGINGILSFGHDVSADAHLINAKVISEKTRVQARILGRNMDYVLPVAGEHMALNSIAVLMAAEVSRLDPAKAIAALQKFEPLKGRGQRKHFGELTVIDESYNASPLSMQAAIRVLGQSEITPPGRRIAALGDMLELGATEAEAHAALASELIAQKVDQVFCCGERMRHLWDALPSTLKGEWAKDAASLAPIVASAIKPHDVVLVKGSRGQQVAIKGVMSPSMAQIIYAIETSFAAGEPPHAA